VIGDAKSAFVTGLHAAALAAGLLHCALAVLALRWMPREPSGTGGTGTGGTGAEPLTGAGEASGVR
jgi:DHA2 family multidrug resistance protein-like MFS transporter